MPITEIVSRSVSEVKRHMDEITEENGLAHRYDEEAADVMSAPDAIRWVTLCGQLSALRRRIPAHKYTNSNAKLESRPELLQLAA